MRTGSLRVGSDLSVGSFSIDSDAVLDVVSTTQGILFPRMTTTERDAISTPTTGLTLFNSTDNLPQWYDGADWVSFGSAEQIIGLSILGTSTTSTAEPTAITATDTGGGGALTFNDSSSTLQWTQGNTGVLQFDSSGIPSIATVTTALITDANVTYAKIQNVAALSVFGRSAATSGVGADISASNGSGGGVLTFNDSANTLQFTQGNSGVLQYDSSGVPSIATVTTALITDANVTYAKIQDVAALSVIGRSANSSGVSAAISATNGSGGGVLTFDDNANTLQFTQGNSGVLQYGATGVPSIATIGTALITDANITYAKIQNIGALSVFGRSAATSGVGADISASNGSGGGVLTFDDNGNTLQFTQGNSGVLQYGATGVPSIATIGTALITDANITYAKIQNVAALSVFGRSANSSGVGAAISATNGSGGGVLTFDDNGNTLQFTQGNSGVLQYGATGVPSIATVSTALIASDAVTGSKLDTRKESRTSSTSSTWVLSAAPFDDDHLQLYKNGLLLLVTTDYTRSTTTITFVDAVLTSDINIAIYQT